MPNAAYTRGFQIISPSRPATEVLRKIFGWERDEPEKFVEFVAQDWRNNVICGISTDSSATTNYFEAKKNRLPFELSPAFFKPEVLSKYRTDRDKYTIGEREINCRSAWHLRAYDVNEAGQVHAYICYLRELPYSEQLHWLSYNEPPKAAISKRAYINDFEGDFVQVQHPLREIIAILRSWKDRKVSWWTIRDERLFERVGMPLTSSVDEWADSLMDLSKLIVEGFEVKWIKKKLEERAIAFEDKAQSLVLMERLTGTVLKGLKNVQRIRSKVKGHAGSSEAQTIIAAAISEHETLGGHFTATCALVVEELHEIEEACK